MTYYSALRRVALKFLTLILLVQLCVVGSGQAQSLSLQDYLAQVRAQNPSFNASQLTRESAELKSYEKDMLLAPSVFGTAQRTIDKKPTSNVNSQGDKTTLDLLQLGVSGQTDFGLSTKFYYNVNQFDIEGTSSNFITTPKYFTASPVVELNQSLWRNVGGKEIRATQALMGAQSEITQLSEEMKMTGIMVEAETQFWRLALAREAIKVTQESVGRAKKLREWAKHRADSQLADASDFLQTDAAYRARILELQLAKDEENASIRAFNSLRGKDENVVNETLPEVINTNVEDSAIPMMKSSRPDVKLSEHFEKISKLNQEVSYEKYQPDVSAFALLSLNGKDETLRPAVNQASTSERPTISLGLKFTAPLGGDSLIKQRQSLQKDILASEANTLKRKFDEKRDWDNLNKLLMESKNKLVLYKEIEEVQKEKFSLEKKRQTNGRTTLFQVLQFEQDLATAQIARIRGQADVLKIIAQMKAFGV